MLASDVVILIVAVDASKLSFVKLEIYCLIEMGSTQ